MKASIFGAYPKPG